jgi:hypothetical protein
MRSNLLKVEYGSAVLDRLTGTIGWHFRFPMDGVASDVSIGEFMSSAGENGWELCGCYPSGNVGVNRPIGPKGELRKFQDVNEEVTFVFKRI